MNASSTPDANDVTVLVTGAGGTGGMASIQALQQTTDFTVVGADMNPKAVGLYAADDAVVVPPATDDEYVERMRDHVAAHDVDAVLPLVDEEVAQVADLRAAAPDTAFVAPKAQFVETCLDKYRLMTELDNAGVAVPETWTVEEALDLDERAYPLVLKPRTGRGGRGVGIVESPDALREELADTTDSRKDLLLQEYIDGVEFTTSVVCTTGNDVLSVVPKEAVQKDRSTVHGVTRDSSAVAASCQQIADRFEPSGPINVQQMCDNDGVPHVIEINPRFSSSTCLTVAAGVNELDLLIRDSLDLPYESPDGFRSDLHMFRYTDQLFVSDRNVLSGGILDVDEV